MTTFSPAAATITVSGSATAYPVRFTARPSTIMITAGKANGQGEYPTSIRDLAVVRLDRLERNIPVATPDGLPAFQFQQRWQSSMEAIERAFAGFGDTVGNLEAIVLGIKETQAAVAAVSAEVQQAQATASEQRTLQRVRDSYTDDGIVTATNSGGDCAIAIRSHERHYLDPKTDVPVNAGSIGGLEPGAVYFVYYDDETLSGGAVDYRVTSDNASAVATLENPYRHVVGGVTTPEATGEETGGGYNPPPWRTPYEAIQ